MRVTLSLNRIETTKCNLGEGLFIKDNTKAWVDINNNCLYISENNSLRFFRTTNQPSIVFDIDHDKVILGTDIGLTNFDLSSKSETMIYGVSVFHDISRYRSNDGGFCNKHQLIGFMHKSNPEDNPGFIYRVCNGEFILIDDSVHIPNSFIDLGESRMLISDSLKGEVWLFEFDKYGDLTRKSLWSQMETGVSPDGGCLIKQHVFIALWDGEGIALFDRDGLILDILQIPLIRPTNCKFDSIESQLWVTSASEGLSQNLIDSYPHSGDTLIFDLSMEL